MTYIQQLTEELVVIDELLNQFTPAQIEQVPRVRQIFRYLHARKLRCERNIKEYEYEPQTKKI